MDAASNVSEPFGTMIYGIESAHRGKECLRCTDIRGRFLAFDVLLTGLESQAVGGVPVSILGDTNDTSGDLAFVFHTASQVTGRGAAEVHGDTKTLSRAENNISAPLSGRGEHYEAHKVGSDCNCRSIGLGFGYKIFVVVDGSYRVGVLYDNSENIGGELKSLVVAHYELHPLGLYTCADYGLGGLKYALIHKDGIGSGFYLRTATFVEK